RCVGLAKVLPDILPIGVLADRVDSDAVATTIDLKSDRPTFVDCDIIRIQNVIEGGCALRELILPELYGDVCWCAVVFICQNGYREGQSHGQHETNTD